MIKTKEGNEMKNKFKEENESLVTRHWSAIKSFKYSRKRSVIYNVMVHENSVTESLESADIDSLYLKQEHSLHDLSPPASLGFFSIAS